MTKYRDILAALTKYLETLPGEVEVESGDVEEGFSRPSFFIELGNIKVNDFMKTSKIRDLTVRIIYFPSNKHVKQVELLDMQESLEKLFIENNYIEILPETEDRESVMVEVENAKFPETKDTLQFQFDINLDEYYVRENNYDKMENLEID
ncbi:MAG: DUF6838 family protein [Psychrilyobacter sp.]|uniref:phage tail terminator family protein n=1 Tax=Psychrilyobacter sp. TaxID=2586924 RepID=UPI003C7590DB